MPATCRSDNRRWLLLALLPLGLMAGVFLLSSVSGRIAPEHPAIVRTLVTVPPLVQNLLHLPVYALLAALWFWMLRFWMWRVSTRVMLALAITVLYGAFDEWHQSFVPGRYATLSDVYLNVAGAVVGTWVAAGWERSRNLARAGRRGRVPV